jgi:hypothetical protein
MFKLSVIRNNEDAKCPFGLSIASACHTAGDAMDEMQEIDPDADNNNDIVAHNMDILDKNVEPKKCKYAAHLFKKRSKVVDCNYGQSDAGIAQQISFNGSPYYSQVGEGLGMGGTNSYPITYYTDGQEYRNLYYGMTNWATRKERLLKRKVILNQIVGTLSI